MSSQLSPREQTLSHLRQVRLAVLRLHKALLDSERVVYEQFHGRIRTNTEFFQLVISHEWFDWLRPISQLIVQMDDVLNAKEEVPTEPMTALLDQTRSLLNPLETGTSLEKRYYQAIQRDPDVAILHAEMMQLIQ